MPLDFKIYIIITTYNPKKWLEKCLNSLIDNEVDVRTIIVDNKSTDGSQQIIKQKYRDFELIQLEENLGFAKANNIGINKALQNGADYFFLLNQDAWIKPATIKKMVEIAEYNSSYGILSPIHLNGSGKLLDWNFSKYISQPDDGGRKLYSDLLLKNHLQEIYEVKYANAAAWLISRKCIEKVGLFEDTFIQQNGEDTNYLHRLHYHNLKFGVLPNVFIYHDRENRRGAVTKTKLTHKYLIQQFILNGLNISDKEGILKMESQIIIEQKKFLKTLIKLNIMESVNNYKNLKRMRSLMPELIKKREIYKVPWLTS